MSYKAASDVAGKTAVFAVLLAAARVLPPASFGVYSLASTIGWILAVGTDLGLQLHLAREVSKAPGRLAAVLAPILRLRAALSAAALLATLLVALVWLPATDALAVALIVSASLLSSLVELVNYGYRAVSRSDLESTLNLVQRVATLALALVLLQVAARLEVLAIAMFLPPVVVLAYSLRHVRRLAAGLAAASVSRFEMSRATFLREVLPIGAGIVLSALYFRVDLFLVEYFAGIEAVGRYHAVFRLVEALRLFPAAVLTVLLPVVFVRQDKAFIWKLSAGLTGFAVLLAVPLYFSAPWLLETAYGASYRAAAPTLQVLLAAFPLLSLNYGLTHHLIGRGHERMFAVICGAALVINVAMNFALIPSLGITGAAWATLGTEALLTAAWIAATVFLRRSPRYAVRSPAS